jgi:trk system potassium uptake protein
MKYIVIGLGNFGAMLANKLTAFGNEVIGIDSKIEKVEQFKEKISHTICLDAKDEMAVSGLPLKDTDVVIVAFGKYQGANIMVTAMFKNMQVKRLISRATNHLHEMVLKAIGVDDIILPEQETAERWAKRLCLSHVVDTIELNDEYSIVEAVAPKDCVGKSISELDFKGRFNLLIMSVIENKESKSLFGKKRVISNINGLAKENHIIDKSDVLILFGANKDIQNYLKLN